METHSVPIIKTNRLILFRWIVRIYCDDHKKYCIKKLQNLLMW
jgi:hypothetical protein